MANTIYKGTFQIQLRSKVPSPVQPRRPNAMCSPASQITAWKATGGETCYHVCSGAGGGGDPDAPISAVHLPEHQRLLRVGGARMLFIIKRNTDPSWNRM